MHSIFWLIWHFILTTLYFSLLFNKSLNAIYVDSSPLYVIQLNWNLVRKKMVFIEPISSIWFWVVHWRYHVYYFFWLRFVYLGRTSHP